MCVWGGAYTLEWSRAAVDDHRTKGRAIIGVEG